MEQVCEKDMSCGTTLTPYKNYRRGRSAGQGTGRRLFRLYLHNHAPIHAKRSQLELARLCVRLDIQPLHNAGGENVRNSTPPSPSASILLYDSAAIRSSIPIRIIRLIRNLSAYVLNKVRGARTPCCNLTRLAPTRASSVDRASFPQHLSTSCSGERGSRVFDPTVQIWFNHN